MILANLDVLPFSQIMILKELIPCLIHLATAICIVKICIISFFICKFSGKRSKFPVFHNIQNYQPRKCVELFRINTQISYILNMCFSVLKGRIHFLLFVGREFFYRQFSLFAVYCYVLSFWHLIIEHSSSKQICSVVESFFVKGRTLTYYCNF